MPGLSDETDGSQESLPPQPSQPLSAPRSAAIGPSSATSPSPHQSMMNRQHLSAMTPNPAPWEALSQPLLGSTGIPDAVPPAQSGYPRQHADEATEAPPPNHMHLVPQCISTAKEALPSQVPEAAAPYSSVSNGSGHASPTAKRRRAAKSLRMMNNTPLAAADIAHSAAVMQNIAMMTVPDKLKGGLSDRIKLSPPNGLPLSPIRSAKPANAHLLQWPAAAGSLNQHARPPMTSPGRPAAHVEALSTPAAHGSSPSALPPTRTDGGARTVSELPNPFRNGPRDLREFARTHGLGCAASEVDAGFLIREASGHQTCLTDDHFQPPRSQICQNATDLFATSSQSMEMAEASSAHYANQLRQQSLQSYPEGQIPDQYAIDLCDDDALLEPVAFADNPERQAQISNDERLARELANTSEMQHLNVSWPVCTMACCCHNKA